MVGERGGDREEVSLITPPQRHFDKLEGKAQLHRRASREKRLLRLPKALREARRTVERERPVAPAHMLTIEHEEGQPAEMIAMEMADENGIDIVDEDARLFQGDERARAEIDEKPPARALEQEAGIEPAAAAEGIACANEPDLHGVSTFLAPSIFMVSSTFMVSRPLWFEVRGANLHDPRPRPFCQGNLQA